MKLCIILEMDPSDLTPLQRAIYDNSIDQVANLIAGGIDVNASLGSAGYPLHYACSLCRIEIVRLLLQAGASVAKRNGVGQTALHIAARSCPQLMTEIILALQQQEKDYPVSKYVNDADLYGNTPVFLVIPHGSVSLVSFLVDMGASVLSVRWSTGDTPLHVAAYHGNEEIVQFLLDSGINPEIKNTDGFSAARMAHRKGHSKIVHLIKSYQPFEVKSAIEE